MYSVNYDHTFLFSWKRVQLKLIYGFRKPPKRDQNLLFSIKVSMAFISHFSKKLLEKRFGT